MRSAGLGEPALWIAPDAQPPIVRWSLPGSFGGQITPVGDRLMA
jgi:hypothetical protein